MAGSLNPTPLDRISRALRPDFIRTVLARRIAAGLLVLLAAASALRPDPAHVQRQVVVSVRDLSPGTTLTADDVTLQTRPAATLPDGAQTALTGLIGATLAGPARRGEVLTDARVLGSRLAGLSAGPDARVVPLRLADSAVLDLLRAGDVVDVLGAAGPISEGPTNEARPRVVASDAVVVLVSPSSTAVGSSNDRVVLVALPAPAATALAGATLVQTVTLTIH
jgi:Flp pilus assembly protein CpaB